MKADDTLAHSGDSGAQSLLAAGVQVLNCCGKATPVAMKLPVSLLSFSIAQRGCVIVAYRLNPRFPAVNAFSMYGSSVTVLTASP